MKAMNKRILIYWALLLCVGLGARAGNTVSLSTAEGAPGEEVTVSIAMENTDAVSTLQVSIPLDESLTLVAGSGVLNAERCTDHSLTVGVKDGVLNVFVYSMTMAPISGTSGTVASFKLKLGDQPTTISLTPSKTALAGSAGQTLDATATAGTVTTRCAKAQYSTMEVDFGAVPIRSTYEQTVTVTNVGNDDLQITALTLSDVNVFSSTTTASLPLTVAPGGQTTLNITYSPVERGSITRTLKVECNSTSKLNTIRLKAQPFAVNELHVQDVSGVSDEEVTISMTMNNMDAISGYQVVFQMPEQLEYVNGSFAASERWQDHTSVVSMNNKVLRIIVYSGNNLPFKGDDGEIGSFRVKLMARDGTRLTPSTTVLSATIDHKVENVVSAVYGGEVSISSPRISTNGSLDFGAVSVTEPCEGQLYIRNYGSAPLTVSRIVFDNEALSVKEQLPMVVEAGQSAGVTVVYGSVEQTAFESRILIYSNDPDQRMREVKVTGNRYAPNFMTVSGAEAFANEEARLTVAIDNYDDVTGLQFDVTCPPQYEAGSCQVAARAAGMTVTARQVGDHTWRYFCYFLSGTGISAGSGAVMTIRLTPITTPVAVGTYQVSVTNIKMGVSNLSDKYAGNDLQTSFVVKAGLRGDANGDGEVNVTDIMAVANHILGITMQIFHEQSADVNGDNDINVTDIMGIANIILGVSTNSSRALRVTDEVEPQ